MPKLFGLPEPRIPDIGSDINIPFSTAPLRRSSVGTGGVFPTRPLQITRNGNSFPSSPLSSTPGRSTPDLVSSSPFPNYTNMGKYQILGKNLQRMHSRTSMVDVAPEGSRYVTYGNQDYFTTTKSPFTDGTYLLYKADGTYGDMLVGKPRPDGKWSAQPPDADRWKYVILNGKEYKTRPIDEFGDHHHLLYPLSPIRDPASNSYGFYPTDAAEAKLLPSGEWEIINPNQNTPSSSRSGTPAPPSSTSSTTSTRSPTPLTSSSREHSQSPDRSTSGSPASGGKASPWQKVKNWFGFA
jgi:hypothetical protein